MGTLQAYHARPGSLMMWTADAVLRRRREGGFALADRDGAVTTAYVGHTFAALALMALGASLLAACESMCISTP